ncbi:MAG: hypothetical protein KA807_19140 [Prolixibacteraceae bacterium]|nr:hypothetical protein [Saprospiraceae bacterium]MBP7509936.1 hypothetical protein [Prolixibacteraceae bacterium]
MKSTQLASILFPITFLLISLFWSDHKNCKSDEEETIALYLSREYWPLLPKDTAHSVFIFSTICYD